MSIVIGGDICITADSYARINNGGVLSLFDDKVVKIFTEADVGIVNLECPLTESERKILKSGPNHKTHINSAKVLSDLKISMVSIANNHILDYGREGIAETKEVLEKLSVDVIGARDIESTEYYRIVSVEDVRIGIISFADDEFNGLMDNGEISVYDPLTSFDEIRALKEKCDALIVLFHAGLEHYEYPTPYLQRVCHKMIDSGADAVLCQHSHCIGAEEQYSNGYILYGQGNFCFFRESNRTIKWNSAIVVQFQIDANKKLRKKLIFIENKNGKVCLCNEENTVKKAFAERSENIRIPGFIENRFQDFCETNRKEFVLSYIRGKSKWYYRIMRLTKGKLFKFLFPKQTAVLVSNLIRSNVHNEIVRTVLKDYIYGKEG